MNIQTITLNNSYLLISLKEFLTTPWRGRKKKSITTSTREKNKDKYYIKNILMIKKKIQLKLPLIKKKKNQKLTNNSISSNKNSHLKHLETGHEAVSVNVRAVFKCNFSHTHMHTHTYRLLIKRKYVCARGLFQFAKCGPLSSFWWQKMIKPTRCRPNWKSAQQHVCDRSGVSSGEG